MQLFLKLLHFLTIYFIPFYFIRIIEIIPVEILKINTEGTAWIYSAMATIFGMVSAFIIQNQWNRWDNLLNATKGELHSIKELYLISRLLKNKNKNQLKNELVTYLNCLNNEKWKQVEKGEISKEIEIIMLNIQRHIFDISDDEVKFSKEIIRTFGKLKSYRNNRLRYGSEHLPLILDIIITFSTYLIIILSIFIYIPNIYMQILFTLSISLFSFLIYTMIKDLNHPYKPGNWHLAKADYSKLLEEIK